jgi:LysR family transcriptional regulator, glycine cleavage system transcriptional activator
MAVRPPPLNALRAFDAVARTLSVKKAAETLFVTPGAISQLIKVLEDHLRVPLFDRVPRGLVLTEAGRQYAGPVHEAFELIINATRAIAEQQHGTLVISTTPSFAFGWLVSRLKRFAARHPGIDVQLRTSKALVDFARDGVDVAIRHGLGRYPGLHSTRIFSVELLPLAAPALIRERGMPQGPTDLLQWPLVHDAARGDWPMWFKAFGVASARVLRGPSYEDASLVLGACLAGEGAALVQAQLAREHLRARRLKRLLQLPWKREFAYYLVCPREAAEAPKVQAFRDWIVSEVPAEQMEER